MEIFGFSISLTPVILTALLLVLAYTYLTWGFGFWKERGIRGPKPYPLFGTIMNFMTKNGLQVERESVPKYGKVYGEFLGTSPLLVIADPKILREVLVKDFSKFSDRSLFNKDFTEEQYATRKFLTVLRGEEWKRVRNTLTPAFSASKMRVMTQQINQCVDILIENLRASQGEQTEVKKSTDAFTFDVIGRVGFGIELDTQKDPNNPFIKEARRIFNPSKILMFKIFLLILLNFSVPRLFKWLSKKFPRAMATTDMDVMDFFLDLIRKIIKQRNEETDKVRNLDLIQLMLDAHKLEPNPDEVDTEIGESVDKKETTPKKGLTEEEVLGQSFLLFLAGFETTSSSISFLLYNLATNPECQEKAQQEIDQVMQDKKTVSYEMTHQFPYLEMCIQESLRLYPPAVRTDRQCTADVTIHGVNIPKDMTINASIGWLHYDPEVWPEPEKFIPERFTPEAKAERDAFSYMPFGMGQRNCIGMRLAQMEVRIAVTKILQNFTVRTCEKTEIPLEIAVGALLKAKNGIHLKFEPRSH